jgi:hypothetical protein
MNNNKSKKMKNFKHTITKPVALLAITIMLASNAMAQKKAEVGLRFMPSISAFDVNTSTGGKVKGEATLGYGVGFLLGWNFSKNISAQGEIIYNSISQKYSENDVEHDIKLKYINIPLLLALNTNKYGVFNLSIVAGPQMGFNVGSSVNSTSNDGTVTSQAVLSVKKSDIGVAYGLGIDFALNEPKTIRLGIGYRAVQGLIDISDNSENVSTDSYYVIDQAKIHTQSIYAGVSILF